MNAQLKEIARKVIYNEDILKLLQKRNLEGLYRGLVDFQIEQCENEKHNSSIDKEGFQVGEPWNGDIENAPILFLSSNPAYNFYEISPRWYWDNSANGGENILKGKNGDPMSLENILDFIRTRIKESPAKSDKDIALRIRLKKDNAIYTPAVTYWGNVRERTEYLLPDELKISLGNKMTPTTYARKIMEYVVCMEVVPFRSTGEAGLKTNTAAIFNHCWNNFTYQILELSGASIFVLVGSKVLNTFTRKINLHQDTKSNLCVGKPLELTIGTRNRIIVYVPFNLGTIPYLPDCLPSETIRQLRDTLARRIIFDELYKFNRN